MKLVVALTVVGFRPPFSHSVSYLAVFYISIDLKISKGEKLQMSVNIFRKKR